MNDKHTKILSIAAVVIFILVMVASAVWIGLPMVRLAKDPSAFQNWVDAYGGWGYLIFIGIITIQVIVALIPGGPFELVAGYAYGTWEGCLLCMAGFLLGSLVVFLLVRKFGVKLVEVFFSKEQIAGVKFLQNPKKTRTLAFILMVIPGSPKDFLNYFAGLTSLNLWEWLLIVLVGRIPALVTTVISGSAAGEKKYLLSIIMMAITLILSGIGLWYYHRLCRQERNRQNPSS